MSSSLSGILNSLSQVGQKSDLGGLDKIIGSKKPQAKIVNDISKENLNKVNEMENQKKQAHQMTGGKVFDLV